MIESSCGIIPKKFARIFSFTTLSRSAQHDGLD